MWENNVCVGAAALYLLADKDSTSKQDHRPANARLRVFSRTEQVQRLTTEFILLFHTMNIAIAIYYYWLRC